MNMRTVLKITRGAAALTLITLAATRAKADGMYGITGIPQGAYGIDNAGQVLTSGGLYQNGVTTPITVPGGTQSIVSAVISPGGVIAYNPNYYGYGDAMVLKGGKTYDAGTASDGYLVGGGEYSVAHAVNDAGAVAGESHAWGRWNRAFTSSPDSSGTYHPVAMGANGGATSNATAINNQGTVVGWSDVVGQWRNHAFVSSPIDDIGTLGGLNSKALAINDKGQVVGSSTIATGYVPPAHPDSYYDPGAYHGFLYQNGKMTDLGTLPGYQNSSAEAINASGQIVGRGYNPDVYDPIKGYISVSHAALFDADTGKPTDLNDLLPHASGWVLTDASGINDSGQIIGSGTFNGAAEGFLLTPSTGNIAAVPEPGTLAFAAVGIAVVALRRRSGRGRHAVSP
jgi:probable HAF family extracellular repeat protein